MLDYVPLYRQSQIFTRQGVELNRSPLANWVERAAWWLEPLHIRLAEQVFDFDEAFRRPHDGYLQGRLADAASG